MGSYFNLVRTFNAHSARFEERRRLLKSLLEIDEEHGKIIESTIRQLDSEWEDRRSESAEVIVELLEKIMAYRESATLDEKDVKVDHRREKIKKKLTSNYYKKINKFVKRAERNLLGIYRHHLIKLEDDSFDLDHVDLETVETWSKWGLTRKQLVMAGAATGAAAGAAIDAATVLLSHGAGALIGGAIGGASVFFKGDKIPDLKVDLQKGVKFQAGEGRKLELGPPSSENFPWIILDRLLVVYAQILRRAHGCHTQTVLKKSGQTDGYVKHLSGGQRKVIQKWLISCAKGNPDRGLDPEVYGCIVDILERAEHGEEDD